MNLDPIFVAVRMATVLTREVQRVHVQASEKAGSEPVTIADYGSQAILCKAIHDHFPDDAIMAEESGKEFMELTDDEQKRQIVQAVGFVMEHGVDIKELAEWLDYGKAKYDAGNAARTWVIDPIDGTKGFLALRHYVIAVGVLENATPTAAVMGCPAYPNYQRGAILHALDGAAYIQPFREGSEPQRIHASDFTEAAKVRVLESVEKSHVSHDQMARVRAIAGLGDAPLERIDSQEKYARIAAGDGELYLRLPRLHSTRPHSTWDHAAGAALVLSAGGRVSDVDGSPLDFTKGKALGNQGIVVSNGVIHDRIIEAVQQVLNDPSEPSPASANSDGNDA